MKGVMETPIYSQSEVQVADNLEPATGMWIGGSVVELSM